MLKRSILSVGAICLCTVGVLGIHHPAVGADKEATSGDAKMDMTKENMMKMKEMMGDEKDMKAVHAEMMKMMMVDHMARMMMKDPETMKMMDEHMKMSMPMMKKDMMDKDMMMKMEMDAMKDPETMKMVAAHLMMMQMMSDPDMKKMMMDDMKK